MKLSRLGAKTIRVGLLGGLLSISLGSEYLHRARWPWQFLNQAQGDVFATFQAADVQWLIVLCISVYSAGFIWLCCSGNRGGGLVAQNEERETGKLREPARGKRALQVVAWASWCRNGVRDPAVREAAILVSGITLYGVGVLAYALQYDQAAKATDTLVFCFGLMVLFGFRCWRVLEERRSQPFNVKGVVVGFTLLLLLIAAVWQPETLKNFQYRGQERRTGLWDNPNTFGVLMGVALMMALGKTVSGVWSWVAGSGAERGTRSVVWWRWLKLAFLLLAAGLCSLGLIKSYSRGAWLGTGCGIVLLFWKWTQTSAHLTPTLSPRPMGGEGESLWCGLCISWLRRNWLPVCAVVASVLVLAFWNYRHTESVVARRVYSASQANDFSWRNRVSAWAGALQMMAEKPLVGFGWNQPGRVHEQYYREPKVAEGAALQLNDYFTVGTTLGIPALFCFVMFVGLNLTRSAECELGKGKGTPHPGPLRRKNVFSPQPPPGLRPPSPAPASEGQAERESRCPSLSLVCRAGAIVLLVGFWFDGGLFKLATGALFWTLLELGREA